MRIGILCTRKRIAKRETLKYIKENYPGELWNVNRRVEGVLGDLDFDGRME
jgi:hypothetical protein